MYADDLAIWAREKNIEKAINNTLNSGTLNNRKSGQMVQDYKRKESHLYRFQPVKLSNYLP
jgi:hypothetical protein